MTKVLRTITRSGELHEPTLSKETLAAAQKALVKVVPTAVKTFPTANVKLFNEATAPKPIKAAMRAYSIKSWPDSSRSRLDQIDG